MTLGDAMQLVQFAPFGVAIIVAIIWRELHLVRRKVDIISERLSRIEGIINGKTTAGRSANA